MSAGPVNYRIQKVSFLVARDAADRTPRPTFTTPANTVSVVRALIPDDAREHFVALYLDTKNRLVATHEVSIGTLSASIVHPREVFGPALRLLGVSAVIVAHNHPSGDPTPSREDILLTQRLASAAQILDLRLLDHIVIGNGAEQFTSFAERGLL